MLVRKSSVRPTLFSVFLLSSAAQRRSRFGLRSMAMVGALLGMLFAAGNARAAATTYTVNVATDSAPTTGGTGSGDTGDLRYALTQAEQVANSGSTINITATGTITLAAALPAISQNTTIAGPGANQLTISGANAYQVFSVTGGTVAISGLAIANGANSTSGGGIAVASGATLQVTGCVFSGNKTTSSNYGGGAILNLGTLTVTGSTFYGNSAPSQGGGAIQNGVHMTATVTNSTFYGNSASVGGAISSDGTLTVTDSTFADNSSSGAGGAIAGENTGTTWTLTNNIFANNSATTDGGLYANGVSGTESYNLFFNNSGGDSNGSYGTGDVHGSDPKLLPAGNYGGETPTMLPSAGSPAICAGSASYAKDASGATLTADQRGFSLNAANCSNGGVDAGAVQTNYLMVTTAADSDDGSCTPAACSLRDAITAANLTGGDIAFNSSLAGSTITVSSALPAISNQVNIVGPGANQLAISGNNSTSVGSVLTVNAGATVSIYGLTIEKGATSGADGGGINNSGTVAVINSAITANAVSSAQYGGGGIFSSGTLTVLDSTISGNSAVNSNSDGGGGGITIVSSPSTLVTGSTISGNTASVTIGASTVLGGGIDDLGGPLVVTNSTISGNTVSSLGGALGGGIYFGTSGNLANSIVAGNTGGDVQNSYTDNGGNLVGTSGINLAALGNYGGPTQTMLPEPGSPAICAGVKSEAVDANGLALTTDQRGFPVDAASYCASGKIDAGAVQTNYTSAQFTNNTGYSALINQVVTPAPILSITENGQNVGGIPVTLTFTPVSGTPTVTGLGPVTTVAGTGATFSSIKVDTAGATDSLSVSLPVGTSSLTASANLEIDGLVALSPGSGALTDAYIGANYSNQLSAAGGKGGYTYALTTGSTLPTWLTLSSSGLLSGTPTATGSSGFSITVTDKKGNTGSAAYTLAVDVDDTSVKVTSSTNPSTVNASVTFTATVKNTSGSSVPSSGTVAFTSDGVGISGCGTVALVAGSSSATATCSISSLTAATATSPHSIVATYSGDTTTYAASTSTALSQTVNKATTTVAVTSTGTAGLNQQVTLTATVSPTSPVALSGGTVAFTDGGTAISGCGTASVDVSTGKATCAATFTTAGSHTISAIYSGDANYSQTVSGGVTTLALSVSKANTTLSIASADNTTSGLAANTSNLNDSVTFTATVVPASPVTGGAALSGKVGFTSNGQIICAPAAGTWDSTAQSYQVTCTTSTLPAGSPSIVATYSNDANYNGSTNNLTQTVNTLPTSTVVTSSVGSSTVNQSVTFTASVTPNTGATKLSGAVTFTYLNTTTSATGTLCNAVGITASTGQASCIVSSLTPGSYTITASYGNDSNYTSSSGTVPQTVNQAATSISLASSPNPSTINQQVTLSATVTAPTGGIALKGTVTFTDNGNSITDCPATTINPNAPTVTCKTSSLALGSHTLVANYGSDANFSNSSSTPVTQTVNPAPTSLTISSSASGNTSVVDQAVSFTAAVKGASGATQFTGTMAFTDNGNPIAGCSAMKVGATTGSATCSTSMLQHGSHTIAATYAGDTNFTTSSNSLTQTVNPGTSTITLVSSPNPSIALNPKGYNDQVGLTATVGPSNGVPLSGTVTFTDNGAPIAECVTGVPVNPSTGAASCITSSLTFGSHTIQAAYNGDSNFTASGVSVTQSVQDYTLAASPTGTVTVGQRFSSVTDPFSSQAISVSASPIAGFTGQLALSCSVVPVTAPEGAVPPTCILGSSTMAITASAQQQPVGVTIDAGTGSNPVATTGTYSVSITGVDSATRLTRTSAAFTVNIRFQAAPITIVSGATTGNTSTVQFSLPPNVGITAIQCASVTGPTLTSSVAPVALSMGCAFDPSTIAAASTSQNVTVTVTVSTNATNTTAQLHNDRTAVVMAGMIGVPLLLLLGWMPGGKSSRKILFRYMGIVFAIVLVLQGTGCGGGQFTAPPSVSGQTPPGSYNILVQGTGTDHQLYQAVVQVNVTR